jgi:hypothetical protein
MKNRYVCVGCQGETCLRCGGRGWVREFFVHVERTDSLVEAIAKNLIEKRIVAVGNEEWARRAADENLTVEQFTEIEIWSASGPVKYGFMGLTDEVIDALADLIGIKAPPVVMEDRPELKVVGGEFLR